MGIMLPAFADNYKDQRQGYDTLSKTQEEYVAQAKTKNLFLLPNDEDIVENTCKSFLSLGRASVRTQDYSAIALVSETEIASPKITYRLSEYEYLNAVNDAIGTKILSDNIEFPSCVITINGDTAEADIVESYTYYTDSFDGYNYRMREYFFNLEKSGAGDWVITSITTNDPWENDSFNYNAIDVGKSVTAVLQPSVIAIGDNADFEKELAATSLYKWSYNTDVAAKYAKQYCSANSESDANELFPFITGNNCQNFASQCVWAGLIGDLSIANNMTLNTVMPAVSIELAGDEYKTNIWCYGQSSKTLGGVSWYRVTRFAMMMKKSTTTTIGPFGNTIYGNLKYADKGSVISINWDGAASEDSMDHAMFVTEATGTAGQRSKANLKYAANTKPTNTAYEPLSNLQYPDSNFATSVISCGYYPGPRDFN